MNQNIDDKANKVKKVEHVSLTISDDTIEAEIADYAKSVNKKRRLKLLQTLLICAAAIMAIIGCIYFKAHYDATQREMLSGEGSAQPVPVEQSGSPVASPGSPTSQHTRAASLSPASDAAQIGLPHTRASSSSASWLPSTSPPASPHTPTAVLQLRPPLSPSSPCPPQFPSPSPFPTSTDPAPAETSEQPAASTASSRPLSPPCSSLEYPQDASASAKSSATTTSSNAAPPTAATQPHTREAPLSPARSLSPPPPGSANDWMQQFQSSL